MKKRARDAAENSRAERLFCECILFPFILDIKFVGRTSRGAPYIIGHSMEASMELHGGSWSSMEVSTDLHGASTDLHGGLHRPPRSLHGPPWRSPRTSMELRGGLHGVPDNVGRRSRDHTRGRSHWISHPPSFCGACLNFSREKDSAIPSPRRL